MYQGKCRGVMILMNKRTRSRPLLFQCKFVILSRSEGSRNPSCEILHFVQNDTIKLSMARSDSEGHFMNQTSAMFVSPQQWQSKTPANLRC